MSKKTRKLLILLLTVALSVVMCSCRAGKDSENTSAPEETTTEVSFDEEADDAVIEKAESTENQFYGTWVATSDQASYLYGNITLNIKDDGTWDGNITDTDMNGTWVKEGNDLIITGEYVNFSLAFTKSGTLVMQRNTAEEGDTEEMINTVLVKK